MASTSKSANWSGDSRFSLIMNLSESYVSGGGENYSNVAWNAQLKSTSGYRTWSYQNNNPLTVNVNGVVVHNGNINYDLSPGATVTVASGTIRVNHDANGGKQIPFSASFTDGTNGKGSASLSGAFTLTKINRYGVTNSVTGSDIEQEFSVNYTKYVTSYKYKLRISIPGVVALETIDYNTSNETFTLSQETIETLYNRYTTTNTFNLGFAVETWNSAGTSRLSTGNEKVISCKITGATPIFDNFDFEDINATTLALTENSKYNIDGYSNIKVTISQVNKAEAQKGASMVKYRFVCGTNAPVEADYSDDSDVELTINGATSGTYNIYAIDSRGNTTLVTKLATQEIAYIPITLNASTSKVERSDGGIGENAILTYNGSIWNKSFGSVTNSIKVSGYQYKETSSSTWITPSSPTDITPTLSGDSFNFSDLIRSNEVDYEFDLQKNYNFRITLEDELSSSTIQLTPMPSGIPNLCYADDGMGIMQDYDESLGGALQVGGDIFVNGKKIVESGNGYIQFSDGTMICYGAEIVNKAVQNTWGSWHTSGGFNPNISFAKTFTSIYTCVVNSGNRGASSVIGDLQYNNSAITNIQLFRGTAVGTSDFNIFYIAIGKWE